MKLYEKILLKALSEHEHYSSILLTMDDIVELECSETLENIKIIVEQLDPRKYCFYTKIEKILFELERLGAI